MHDIVIMEHCDMCDTEYHPDGGDCNCVFCGVCGKQTPPNERRFDPIKDCWKCLTCYPPSGPYWSDWT